jgi:putative ABC transport system permease protein
MATAHPLLRLNAYFDDSRRTLRRAARSLVRRPGFAIAVVLSLALGIGANAAMYTIIDAVLLRPLPYPRSQELVTIGLSTETGVTWWIGPGRVEAWAAGSHALGEVAAVDPYSAAVRANSFNEYREGAQATSNLLRVLQISPALGRWFLPEDEHSRAHLVVLSHEFWRAMYGSDTGAIGRTLSIYGQPWTIIGVLPSGASRPFNADYWLPTAVYRGHLIARPRPGAVVASLPGELGRLLPPFEGRRAAERPPKVVVVPLRDQLHGSARSKLGLLFWAVLLLLLLACANVTNLSLTRVLEQRHAVAVRATLGASRWSLASAVLAENMLLAACGGALGILVAFWTTRIAVRMSPEEITRVGSIDVNGSGIAYAAALAVATALLVTVAPGYAATRGDLSSVLSQGGTRTGRDRTAQRVRRALVVCQIAVALLLVTGAGLFVRSLARLSEVNLGFDPHGIVTATVNLIGAAHATGPERLRDLGDRLRALPDVEAVAYGPPPLVAGRGQELQEGFDALWFARSADSTGARVATRTIWVKYIDAGYLATFRIPLRAGRGILTSDDARAPAVALVNAAAAKLFFHDTSAVGRLLPKTDTSLSEGRPITIVGEVDDAHQRDVTIAAEPEILVPAMQQDLRASSATISVRTRGRADALIAPLRKLIEDADPDLPIMKITTMQAVVDGSLAPHRFLLFLFASFATLAVALASLGLYAVVAYLVTQRTHEIGVRFALGAQRNHVMRMVLGEGMVLVAAGGVIGIAAALALSRVLTSFLYEVKPRDVPTFVAAPILLAAMALLATYIPARRASKVDPMLLLRGD